MRRLHLLALLLFAAACAGSGGERFEYVEKPVEALYNEAADELDKGRFEQAVLLFDEVERQHPYSAWARRAMLMSAYASYRANDYDTALAGVDRFIGLHPGNSLAPYAFYLRAMSHYEQIRDVGRDQDITREALAALTDVIRRYPDSDYARDAELKLDLTYDHLAGKEMYVGRYYLRNSQHIAAINRFKRVVTDYQTTTQVPEALHRLVEAYVELGVYDEARATAAVLGHNYPGSEWYRDSYELLRQRGALNSNPVQPIAVNGPGDEDGEEVAEADAAPNLSGPVVRHAAAPIPPKNFDESSLRADRAAMLTALAVRDIVLIDRLDLAVGPGLTALTGETGAGKSILLDALGLAVGGRAEKRLVRRGREEGTAIAAFEPEPGHGVWAILDEHGVPAEDGAVILRRVQRADGRARAFVNDQPVSLQVLRAVGEALVEVHGQQDGHGFLKAAAHRALLDQYAGVDAAGLAAAFAAVRDLEAGIEERRASAARAAEDADYLRHALGELDALAPQAGEEARLAETRAAMAAAEKAAADVAEAADAAGGERASQTLSRAARAIARALDRLSPDEEAARAMLGEVAASLDAALAAADEAAAVLDRAHASMAVDEGLLEETEARLFAIRALARKHAVPADDLPALRDRIAADLDRVESGEEEVRALEKRLAAARADYDARCADASTRRRRAAAELESAVVGELRPLKLDRARFAVSVEPDETRLSAQGWDAVEFRIATNPGAEPGPLAKIASGGELARIVLALKAALAAKEGKTVVIFDEVDAGVGGAVADAVGERLARLAAEEQVLVVTHSPQVAARAASHWKVAKDGEDDVLTSVRLLNAGERVEEIARMLAGAKVTDAAREAARALLDPPRPAKPVRRRRTAA